MITCRTCDARLSRNAQAPSSFRKPEWEKATPEQRDQIIAEWEAQDAGKVVFMEGGHE